jgi:predicted DNA-binding transcriptional regulator AlpA
LGPRNVPIERDLQCEKCMGHHPQATSNLRNQNPIETPQLLTAKDLEALLQIDVKTIYSYVQRGLIPYVRIQSNLRFRRQEVLDWVASQSYPPRASVNGYRRHRR